MVRKPDQPIVDLKSLQLPAQPKVVDVRAAVDWDPLGYGYVQVWVVLESLLPEQEENVAWAMTIEDPVAEHLRSQGDDRVVMCFFRLPSELRPGDLPAP
ncbi:MAG: hypothetical protein IPJ19_18840 [Planctomycetes bacterium]|nr:hypothetical protein [Planctomycetota bacterium]